MPLPHEPVSFEWDLGNGPGHPFSWSVAVTELKDMGWKRWLGKDKVYVTLANGQRIIVRAKL